MQSTSTNERVQKLDEAKELVAELEEEKGIGLSGPRGALWDAGETVDSEQTYRDHMEKAMAQTAGLAIEGGYDDIASEATELVADLQRNQSDND